VAASTGSSSLPTVRRLEGCDWETLRRLRLAALADSPQAFLSHPERERPDVVQDWQRLLDVGIWWVAHRGRSQLGLACLVLDPETGNRYLESMWVDPTQRRRAVASTLLHAVEDTVRAEHRHQYFLWVLSGNDAARDFYLRRGFRPTGRRQRLGPPTGIVEEEFARPLAPRLPRVT
jgi:GNAT superfamily N-acetyltransferase